MPPTMRCRPGWITCRAKDDSPSAGICAAVVHNQSACKWDPRRGSRRSELVRSGSRSGRRKRRKASNDPFCDRSQREIARARRSNNEDRDVRVQLQSENPPTVHEERDLARTFHAKRRAHRLDRPDQRGGHHGQDLERDVVPSPSGEQPPGPGKQDDGLERVVRLDQRCQVNRSRRRAGHLRIPRLVSAQEAKRSKDRLSVVQIMAPLRPVKDRDETTSGTPKEFNASPHPAYRHGRSGQKCPPVVGLARRTVRDSRIENRWGREGSCPMPPLKPGPKSRLLWTCSWRKGGGDEGSKSASANVARVGSSPPRADEWRPDATPFCSVRGARAVPWFWRRKRGGQLFPPRAPERNAAPNPPGHLSSRRPRRRWDLRRGAESRIRGLGGDRRVPTHARGAGVRLRLVRGGRLRQPGRL